MDDDAEVEPNGAARLSYTLDTARGILRQRWRGTIEIHDVVALWHALIADTRTLAYGLHLNDLRGCVFNFSGTEWHALIVEVLERMPEHAPWRAAIVVDNLETLGVVRQFLGYAGDLVNAEIFADCAAAEAWLVPD